MQEEFFSLPAAQQLKKLSDLPFGSQLSLLTNALQAKEQLATLIKLSTKLRDHEPLAFLVGLLAKKGLLTTPSLENALKDLFVNLPDTGIQRVLRHIDRLSLSAKECQPIIDAIRIALPLFSLNRLAAVCLIDRWLKNAAPAEREALCEQAFHTCKEAIKTQKIDAIDDLSLLLCPGNKLLLLEEQCKEANVLYSWQSRMQQFANRVLFVLEAMPKSLSQANAEELLSRRVYTDPGHFFVELLQNAEDALAKEWNVTINTDEITVWHNGIPFDAKDVVGVLSIGQTTKRKGQIGFFGVGFKAVYEISERPQVYSGPYRFEVADISIPRRLGERPDESSKDGTLLVLPLRNAEDPQKTPEVLYEKALNVPPETLLTLSSLERFGLSFGKKSRVIHKKPGDKSGQVALVHEEEKSVSQYLVEADHFVFQQKNRELSRVSETPILIAIKLDSKGIPISWDSDRPTIFSYLPTGERSGLRFLLHAHFDLPIDRERLDLSSPWNEWAILQAGTLLARLIKRLVKKEETPPLDGILKILPLAEEVGHPAYHAISKSLTKEIQETPFLPTADQKRVSPQNAAVLFAKRLIPVLAGVSLTKENSRALCALQERETKVVLSLGATYFDETAFQTLLSYELKDHIEGEAPKASWIQKHSSTILEVLGENLEKYSLETLETLAIIPDVKQGFWTAEHIKRADKELREVYGNTYHFLAPTLDHTPTASQETLFTSLLIQKLTPHSLIEDLENKERFHSILSQTKPLVLLQYLASLPSLLTKDLGSLPLFPDETEVLYPLLGSDTEVVWILNRNDTLSDWLRNAKGKKPPLIEKTLKQDILSFCQQLGGKTLTLKELLVKIRQDEFTFSDLGEVFSLHHVIESFQEDLTPRLCEEIRKTPIFPDTEGTLRALVGEEKALLAADKEIEQLANQAPWLDDTIAQLPYISKLGIDKIGPQTVVQALLEETTQSIIDTKSQQNLRRIYAYLLAHTEGISASQITRLAQSPVWLDTYGQRFRLDQLRRESTIASLAELYRAWRRFPMIEDGENSSAYQLVCALQLETKLSSATYETFVDDLLIEDLAVEDKENDWSPATVEEIAKGDLRPLLIQNLQEASIQLSKSRLERLKGATIFQAHDGFFYPLGSWENELDEVACYRAHGVLREPLLLGSRPILSETDEAEYQAFLDTLTVQNATALDLVSMLEQDTALQMPKAYHAARKALSLVSEELEQHFVARKDKEPPNSLEKLPLWPSKDGRFLAADEVVRGKDLARELGSDWESLLGDNLEAVALLDESADPEAEALQKVIRFGTPLELILGRIAKEAKPGEELSLQEPFLQSVEKVTRLLRVVSRHLTDKEALLSLPLSVDATSCLVKGPRLFANEIELILAKPLSCFRELAHPEWAKEVYQIEKELTPPLPARRFLLSLAEVSKEACEAKDHPVLAQKENRELLYRWLLERKDEIEQDEQAWGILGKSAVICTKGNMLRAPRELLLEPDIPDLGLDWNAAEEVPPPLVDFLRRVYRLEEKQLSQLVGFLLDGHEEAVSNKDGARSYELLQFLARCLRPQSENLGAMVKRFRLQKRLRVESEEEDFQRPRKMLACEDEQWELIQSFMQEPPDRVSSRYQNKEVQALLQACGASEALSTEVIESILAGENQKEGKESALALARYLAQLAKASPSLRETLSLEKSAWIPNGEGKLCTPKELYWPDPDVSEVVGDRPLLYPHPAFFHTVPKEITSWLPFRKLSQASFSDVLNQIETVGVAYDTILRWLEIALSERRVDAKEARNALQHQAFLLDDEGLSRPPRDLLRIPTRELFGHHRGFWSDAQSYPRLADALKIPAYVSLKTVKEYLEEIVALFEEKGQQTLLEEDPSLTVSLPRVLSRFAELVSQGTGKKASILPDSFLVLAQTTRKNLRLCVVPEPKRSLVPETYEKLLLPEPEAIADAAIKAKAPVSFPITLEETKEEVLSLLAGYGVPDLHAYLVPVPLPKKLLQECTDLYQDRVVFLEEALEKLLQNFTALRRSLHHIEIHRWRKIPDWLELKVHIVKSLKQVGTLASVSIDVAVPCIVEPPNKRLILIPACLEEVEEIAQVLCRDLLCQGEVDARLLHWVTHLLETNTALWVRERPTTNEEKTTIETPEAEEASQRENQIKARVKRNNEKRPVPPEAPPEPVPEIQEVPEVEDNDSVGKGIFSRIRRWIQGDDEDNPETTPKKPQKPNESTAPERREKPKTPPPPGRTPRTSPRENTSKPWNPDGTPPRDHGNWFRARGSIDSQLRASPDWLADRDRPPGFGLAFAPKKLPLPYLYGSQLISDQFDSKKQRWLRSDVSPEWELSGETESARLVLQGKLPTGDILLPIPLYGKILQIESHPEARQIKNRDQQVLLLTSEDTEVRYEVSLGKAPAFEHGQEDVDYPPLSRKTVPDEELPEEIHEFLHSLGRKRIIPLQKALAIRDFIRQRYRYDPSYFEDPAVARWLRSVSRGRANTHIAALHAGKDANFLGRGVCYELNVLACELLRRSKIPAAISTGWTFDRGMVTEPDHLWAMALLPSNLGPRWLPIDASSTREGRPLHAGNRRSGPWRVRKPPKQKKLPKAPSWDKATEQRRWDSPNSPQSHENQDLPLEDLIQVARYIEMISGEQIGNERALRRRCQSLLADPVEGKKLLDLLRNA